MKCRSGHRDTTNFLTLCATLLICIPVLAQTSPPAATRDNTFPATHGSGAEGEGLKQKHFEIKSCALSEALRAYADQTGEQVVFFSDVGKDQQSVEVAGTYTNDAVLSRMLSKSGLTFERLNPHTIAITSNSRTTAAKTSLMYQTSLSRDEGKGLLRLAQNSSSDTPARNRPSADGTQTDSDKSRSVALDEILVTGSRIARSSLDVPVPVSVMDARTIEQSGFSSLSDVLARIPALALGTNPVSTAYGGNNVGANFADLRGLGTNRTLTLINGRRRVPGSDSSAAVDLSTIPASMVDRIEVITGGASAVYGADAVSGVLNVILKHDFDGLTLEAHGSHPGYSGGGSHSIDLLAARRLPMIAAPSASRSTTLTRT